MCCTTSFVFGLMTPFLADVWWHVVVAFTVPLSLALGYARDILDVKRLN